MSVRLLLDEHYSSELADRLRADGHDVVAVVEGSDPREQPDAEIFRRAAADERRVVTENIKDFRPLLVDAYSTGDPLAQLVLVSPKRFPRGGGAPTAAIATALLTWLSQRDVSRRPDEDWLH